MKAPALIALAVPVLLAGCASGPSAEEQAAMAADARKASAALIQKLGGELKAAIGTNGPGRCDRRLQGACTADRCRGVEAVQL